MPRAGDSSISAACSSSPTRSPGSSAARSSAWSPGPAPAQTLLLVAVFAVAWPVAAFLCGLYAREDLRAWSSGVSEAPQARADLPRGLVAAVRAACGDERRAPGRRRVRRRARVRCGGRRHPLRRSHGRPPHPEAAPAHADRRLGRGRQSPGGAHPGPSRARARAHRLHRRPSRGSSRRGRSPLPGRPAGAERPRRARAGGPRDDRVHARPPRGIAARVARVSRRRRCRRRRPAPVRVPGGRAHGGPDRRHAAALDRRPDLLRRLARQQAHARHRRRERAADRARPAAPADLDRDQARLARAGALHPAALGASRRDLQALQVPLDARGVDRRGAAPTARSSSRARTTGSPASAASSGASRSTRRRSC